MAWSAVVFSACVTLAVACSDDNSPTDQLKPGIGVWDTRAPLPTARQEMPSALLGGRSHAGWVRCARRDGRDARDLRRRGRRLDERPSMPEGRNHPGSPSLAGWYSSSADTSAGPASARGVCVQPTVPDVDVSRWDARTARRSVAVEYVGKDLRDRRREHERRRRDERGVQPVDRHVVHSRRCRRRASIRSRGHRRSDLRRWWARAGQPRHAGSIRAGHQHVAEARRHAYGAGRAAAAASGGKLYVFGGEAPGVFPHNEEFDPSTNTWRRVADMPTPRHGMGAVTVGNAIYVIGGGTQAGFGASAVNERYTPSK